MFTLLPFVAVSSAVGTLWDNCSQHIYYRDSNGDLHELWWQSAKGWKHSNITKQINAPLALSNPVGYCSASGEYIYYYSTDKHIYQLYRNDPRYKFVCTDITLLAQLSVEPVGDLIVWPLATTEHLFFRDIEGKIRELYNLPLRGWQHSNLTYQVSVPYVETCSDDKEEETEEDVKQLMREFETSSISTPPIYPQLYPRKMAEALSDKGLEERVNLIQTKIIEERISVDFLKHIKSGIEVQSTEQELLDSLKRIKKDKDEVLREIKVSLKQKNLILGNVCGHASTPSQYLFFVGKDNHLHLMRYGVSLFSEIKRDDVPIVEQPKSTADESWWTYTYSMAKSVVDGLSNTVAAIQPQWTRYNLTSLTPFYTIDKHTPLCIVGTPTSHSTVSHSQHVFCIDFPKYHVHEFAWYSNVWEHRDLTTEDVPPAAAEKGLSSYATNLYQYVYFADKMGNLWEMRRKIGDERWLFCNVHQQILGLPSVVEIYSSATLGLTNSVIYYKDEENNIIELACTWDITFTTCKWYWKNLSTLPRFLAIPKPAGKILSYSKGIVESLSSISQNTIYNGYNYVMSLTPYGSDATQNDLLVDDQEDAEIGEAIRKFNEHKIELEKQKRTIQEYSELIQKTKEDKETEVKTREMKLSEYKQQLEHYETQKLKIEQENSKLEKKIKEEMEERRRQQEQAALEREEKAKLQEKIQVLTHGLGYDTYHKIQLQTDEKRKIEIEAECTVCLEPTDKTLKCGHKLCEGCFEDLPKKQCPCCEKPIQDYEIVE